MLLVALLPGCDDPIPVEPDKMNYVGLWVASDRYISIFSSGRLEYREKLDFGLFNRVSGAFVFEGNELNTTMFSSFRIDKPPHEERGEYTMVMDGVNFVRVGPPIVYGRSSHWPEGLSK